MLLSQVTITYLQRFFQVDPDAVWLQDEFDDTAFFPNDDGSFTDLRSAVSLFVEGPPARSSSGISSGAAGRIVTLSSTPDGQSAASTSSAAHPSFRSVVPGLGRRVASTSGSNTCCRVKVVKAEMEWTSDRK